MWAILDGRRWLFTSINFYQIQRVKKHDRIWNFWLEKWISVNCCNIGRVKQWLHTKLVTASDKNDWCWQECVSCHMNFIYKMSNLWGILSNLVCVWNMNGLCICMQCCLFYFFDFFFWWFVNLISIPCVLNRSSTLTIFLAWDTCMYSILGPVT